MEDYVEENLDQLTWDLDSLSTECSSGEEESVVEETDSEENEGEPVETIVQDIKKLMGEGQVETMTAAAPEQDSMELVYRRQPDFQCKEPFINRPPRLSFKLLGPFSEGEMSIIEKVVKQVKVVSISSSENGKKRFIGPNKKKTKRGHRELWGLEWGMSYGRNGRRGMEQGTSKIR